ncbi:RsmD family RNA methyltransferase [Capnocytophaga catalasegens]|uniref:Methyltransferase n=1 Tax=Capnocytophaga catalasegens TaxID=1004260 RepID=A0AAV5AQ14_9FLAO|nr:RsmD family RNA methyltransferase [Capnocytophaga catalasegens]GIZ14968.1 methyltransferase [Capnocytophaga catalasegens]GJM49347.1 methyltransferase [Capnocytophaga catalasegens]GJM52498.1 methyltransferase [Capnocytophaga catalasegens]
MRIISGKNKGKRIIAPSKLPVRPTTDFAKEALFNILNNHFFFDDICVLDLFAGTGNISYEFASRGTTHITSVDSDISCIKFIQKTANELDFDIQAVKADVYIFLEKTNAQYDIIFADPPYEFSMELFSKIISLIFKRNLLEDEGMLIVEHSIHTDLSDVPNFSYCKKYGGCILSFFKNQSQ